MKILEGMGVSPGIVIAPAHRIERGEITVEPEKIDKSDVDIEIERYKAALQKSKDQLVRIQASVAKAMGESTAAIIEPQIMLMSDATVVDETIAGIKTKNLTAESAFDIVIRRAIVAMESSEDTLMAERAHDLHDVRRRVLSNLMGMAHHIIQEIPEDRVLVIQHLAPSETAQLFHNKFVGIAIEMGGTTSHVAIMTRTMEIPCVLGLPGVTGTIESGQMVIVDGTHGKVVVEPDEETLEKYRQLKEAQEKRKAWLVKFKDEPAITKDDHRISVGANMELPGEVETVLKYGAEGIGLFRTELLYTKGTKLPDEDEQTEVYQELADKIAPHPLVVRTFDIGGDKFAEILGTPFEPNPFLGWRAIRIGLSRPRVLKTQLKAVLRAAYKRNIKLMFPMVSNRDEVLQTLALLKESRDELRKHGKKAAEKVDVGIMVEIPSAAILAREMAPLLDFFSIGTNDLVQYTLAVDRGNQRVSHLYQSYNPAVLKLVKYTVDAAHFGGIWCGLCGEMAADPMATVMLIGMGLDELSVNPPAVPMVKGIIRSISIRDARRVAEECLRFSTQDDVLKFLEEKNRELLPPEFIEKD